MAGRFHDAKIGSNWLGLSEGRPKKNHLFQGDFQGGRVKIRHYDLNTALNDAVDVAFLKPG